LTNGHTQKDVVILVADKNMQFALGGLLARHQTLGICQLTSDLYVHPERDPGCLLRSHVFLRPFIKGYAHALVMFDREGCGQEQLSRPILERQVEDLLSRSGWSERAAAIVLDPELEIWVWSDSPHVDSVLGWQGRQPDLRTWLRDHNFLDEQHAKPNRPKMAVEQALRSVRRPRSSSLYLQLAQSVSFNRCSDPAFLKLKTVLQKWFPEKT
jgi:hypothetical protein